MIRMSRVVWCRLGVWGTAMLLAVRVSEAREYTLDELVSESMRTSKEIKKVESELAKTEEQIWEAKGGAFPRISASANYQYAWEQYNPFGSAIDFSAFSFETDTSAPTATEAIYFDGAATSDDSVLAAYIDGINAAFGQIGAAFSGIDTELPKHTFNMSLALEQPLFAQGKVRVGLRIARAYRQSVLCKYDAARQRVKARATKLFYGALLAKRNLEIREGAVGLSEEVHRLTVLRQGVGTGSVVDTLSSRLELEKARMEQRKARGDLHSAYDALLKMAGLVEPVEEFSVAGEFPNGD
ncbi:MAG: hypothetical protein GF331_10640, partial [Chitinivibrionales bacterium]|nr:hypothetical protein [Chitinivibrionales bacterium]